MEFLGVALGDWHHLLPTPWCEMLCVTISILCGAIVGFEREKGHKPAGLRTMILISVGSAVFTIVSIAPPLGRGDPARIAAQIVTGVGFLGTGAILRDRLQVTGLTTAATIWVSSAIGITAGAGYLAAAVLLSLATLLVLGSFRLVETRLLGRCHLERIAIVYRVEKGKTRARLTGILDEARGPISIQSEATRSDGLGEIHLRCCTLHREHRAFLSEVAHLAEVDAIEKSPE